MNAFENKLIIISGPTASGKTSTSITVAKYLIETHNKQVAIINFDSLLFYKELNIGTAKPTVEEMNGVTHYLINNRSISHPLNASDYCDIAHEKIKELLDQDIIIILVGGSGFYLRALIKGMYDSPKIDESLRAKINKEYEENGIAFIREFLKIHDVKSYDTLHENDHYRNIRAYEHFVSHDSPISLEKEKAQKNNPYDFSKSRYSHCKILHFYLDVEKDLHQEIITSRAQQMIKDGLVEEVKSLLDSSEYSGDEKALQSIGYKETIGYIRGEFSSMESYIERITISTRQLAKAQRTFFNKVTPKIEIHPLKEVDIILKELDHFTLD